MMNIHLPAILMFTRGIGFWPIPIWNHSSSIWIHRDSHGGFVERLTKSRGPQAQPLPDLRPRCSRSDVPEMPGPYSTRRIFSSPDTTILALWTMAGVVERCGDLKKTRDLDILYIYGFMMMCSDLWGFMMICRDLWGFMMICSDLWGFVMMCGDLWGCVVVYGDFDAFWGRFTHGRCVFLRFYVTQSGWNNDNYMWLYQWRYY
jgi:hypothetical protein